MAIELEAEYCKALLERELAYLGYQAAFEIDFVTANFRDIVPTEKANQRCKIEGLDFECCLRKSIPRNNNAQAIAKAKAFICYSQVPIAILISVVNFAASSERPAKFR